MLGHTKVIRQHQTENCSANNERIACLYPVSRRILIEKYFTLPVSVSYFNLNVNLKNRNESAWLVSRRCFTHTTLHVQEFVQRFQLFVD